MTSLADITPTDVELDLESWAPTPDAAGLLVRNGVLLRAAFQGTPPTLLAALTEPDVVRDEIARTLASQGTALVDFEVVEAGGGRWMRTVAKRRGDGRASTPASSGASRRSATSARPRS